MTIGLAILAAGSSSRMGRAKQLLPWGGTTLIRSVVAQAIASGLGPVACVLGAQAERIRAELHDDPVTILVNDRHLQGPGTSVHTAARWAASRRFDGLLVLLADQPRIRATDLERLASTFAASGALAAGAAYDDGVGVPAIFSRDLFHRLVSLPVDGGAKAFLRSSLRVAAVPFPDSLADLDTPADYSAEMAHRV